MALSLSRKPGSPTITTLAAGTSGTYVPPSGCTWFRAKIQGSGGGGAGGQANTAAGAGGATSFGGYIAGGGGGAASWADPGAGGSVTLGTGAIVAMNLPGNYGDYGDIPNGGTSYPLSGSGGNAYLGGPGRGGWTSRGAINPTGFGGGGGGGLVPTVGANGSAGGGSGAYLELIFQTPGAGYTYSVGLGGAGSAAVNGGAGTSGGPGVIITEEYYE